MDSDESLMVELRQKARFGAKTLLLNGVIGISEDYSLRCECEGMIRDIESGEISFHQGDC